MSNVIPLAVIEGGKNKLSKADRLLKDFFDACLTREDSKRLEAIGNSRRAIFSYVYSNLLESKS